MKTAEDWIKDHDYFGSEFDVDVCLLPLIKQIQLDAYRAGGLAAAEMVFNDKDQDKWLKTTCDVKQAILTHFNNPQLEIPV